MVESDFNPYLFLAKYVVIPVGFKPTTFRTGI